MTGTNAAPSVSQRVNAGVELLDRLFPGWAQKVDPDRLLMASCSRCVLGQLFGDFFDGLDWIEDEAASDPQRFGFDGMGWQANEYYRNDCDALAAGWRRVIAWRRPAP